MRASAARRAALKVITRVRERSAFAHETLDTVLSSTRIEPRDAALATRLAYGAIATRGTLDEAVARSLDEGTVLEPRVADALALGAYELLYARTPSHAAVSETVELVREFRPRATGLANAVMRRIVKAAETFPWGNPDTDNAALARLHGHPRWLAELWIEQLGRAAATEIMAANNEPAPLYLAMLGIHPDSEVVEWLAEDGADPSPGPLPASLVAGAAAATRRARALKDGDVLVMDAGAQFAVHAVSPSPGDALVEIGAGRGGKTLLLAALARRAGGPAAEIAAVDLHAFKLESLSEGAAKAGFAEVRTIVADATAARADVGVADKSADAVLIDAPCSGLGTLRRPPDRRWRAQRDEIETLALLGEQLLGRAARLVKPGGCVVYSTCTIAKRENAEVIEGFLASPDGAEFRIETLIGYVPDEWAKFVTPEGYFQSLPAQDGPDGHFVARLVRA
ncbi:MAG TPA: transcription antitermination factor NusB [Coriobacteriia bacterium]|nr:transcription antitermination factor NusB [Coriobacteriia bacterium]